MLGKPAYFSFVSAYNAHGKLAKNQDQNRCYTAQARPHETFDSEGQHESDEGRNSGYGAASLTLIYLRDLWVLAPSRDRSGTRPHSSREKRSGTILLQDLARADPSKTSSVYAEGRPGPWLELAPILVTRSRGLKKTQKFHHVQSAKPGL